MLGYNLYSIYFKKLLCVLTAVALTFTCMPVSSAFAQESPDSDVRKLASNLIIEDSSNHLSAEEPASTFAEEPAPTSAEKPAAVDVSSPDLQPVAASSGLMGLLQTGIQAGVAGILGIAADSTGSSILSSAEFMVGSQSHSFSRITGKINDLEDHLCVVEQELQDLKKESEKYFNEIIDILRDQDIESRRDVINGYVDGYRVAWDTYMDVVEFYQENPGPYTDEQKNKLSTMMDDVVVLTLGSAFSTAGYTKLSNDINGLANVVSDCSEDVTLNGVSAKANERGGHTNKQTYIKAIKSKALEHGGPLFEHQLYPSMQSASSEVAMGQLQMLVL